MDIIITYDVPSKHIEIKAEMRSMGYRDIFSNGAPNTLVHLPNTTLAHSNKTPNGALEDLERVCAKFKVDLKRCIATRISEDWQAIGGTPFD